jgi:hypothetical protein
VNRNPNAKKTSVKEVENKDHISAALAKMSLKKEQ